MGKVGNMTISASASARRKVPPIYRGVTLLALDLATLRKTLQYVAQSYGHSNLATLHKTLHKTLRKTLRLLCKLSKATGAFSGREIRQPAQNLALMQDIKGAKWTT